MDLTPSGEGKIIGVISHTFHFTEDGDIDEGSVQSDRFGKYIKDVTISPLSQSTKLKEVLALDIEKLPLIANRFDAVKACGYPTMAAAVAEATKALEFLKNAKDFDPLFWAGALPPEAMNGMREGIKAANEANRRTQKGTEIKIPYAGGLFKSYAAVLQSSYLSKFKAMDMPTLALTNSYEKCPDLECTDFSTFTILANRFQTDNYFAKVGKETFQKSTKGLFGHELGHYVLTNYYLGSKTFATPEEMTAKIPPLKFHVTVDAIGMILAGYQPKEFAKILSTITSNVHGVERMSADFEDREKCFTQLN